MENYVINQSKQLQELKTQTGFFTDSLSKLNTKVDSIATHTKMLETQISQVAQQVAASCWNDTLFLLLRQNRTLAVLFISNEPSSF